MRQQNRSGLFMMIGVLAASGILRFYDLRHSPGWYHDETIFIGQAWNLIHGHFQWDAVSHTYLPHLPLFHLLLGPLLVVFGKDIIWVRALAAISGLGITWLIYKTGREMESVYAGVLGAAMFALCPYTILLTRWGLTYSVAALLGAINLYFLVRHARSPANNHSLLFASLASGLGMLIAPIMGARLLATFVVALITIRTAKVIGPTLIMLAPIAIYLCGMLLFAHDLFLEEVNVIWNARLSSKEMMSTSLSSLGVLFGGLRGYGYLGAAGMFFLPSGNARRVLIWTLLLDLLLSLKVADTSSLYRMGIIFTPALFVALGFLLEEIRKRTLDWLRYDVSDAVNYFSKIQGKAVEPAKLYMAQKSAIILAGFIGICLLALITFHSYREIQSLFPSMYAHFRITTLHHTKAAERTVKWLRPQLSPDDLVVTTHLEWMLPCRTASPMLVQLAEGGKGNGVYFPALRNRLLYPCRLKDARFAILHEASPRIASVHNATPILNRIVAEWKMVHSDETIQVYANPEKN